MANPSYTYTLTNGTTADADQVMQNFSDILNGVTDGTKDLSIAALTVAGTATFNGNMTLGNSSSDDITMTGSLASTIPVKTTNTYNIGSASLGLAGVYFGTSDSDTARIVSDDLTASRTYTMPDAGGNASFVMTAGAQTIGGAKTFSSSNLTLTDATSGIVDVSVNNTSTGASRVFIDNGSGAGDVFNLYRTGSRLFSLGIDQSDSQAFKLTYDTTTASPSSGSEFMKLATTGAFTFGTTTQTAPHTIQNANTGDTVLYVRSQAAADSSRAAINVVKTSNDVTSAQDYIWFYANAGASNNGAIVGNGAGAANWGTISDRRLKTNIQPIDSTLEKILSLNPCSFDYINGGHNTGFIAQELQEHFPDSVKEKDDGMLEIVGWSKTDARIVKAIQELKSEIDALKQG